jgi:hypothetical protein
MNPSSRQWVSWGTDQETAAPENPVLENQVLQENPA